jgi:aspartyl/glutamyl-tRNA(Asn/Gln) amidotransferase C subunit
MAVTREDVRRVGELARLSLDASEIAALTQQLNAILEHMEALDAAAADPASAEWEDTGRAPLRTDEPAADPLIGSPARIAPAWEAGFFTVPRLASHEELGEERAEAGREGT